MIHLGALRACGLRLFAVLPALLLLLGLVVSLVLDRCLERELACRPARVPEVNFVRRVLRS
jgi:hypothetical protein